MIVFNSRTIFGIHGPLWWQVPEFQSAKFKFFGLDGVSEINGGRGMRRIDTQIWIHNKFTTFRQLVAYLELLDRRVGEHGDLKVTSGGAGGVPRTYPHCTFLGFDPDRELGPLPDFTGQLDGIGTTTHWQAGTLTWNQLRIKVGSAGSSG